MSDRSVSGEYIQSVIVTGDGNTVHLCFGSTGLVLPLERRQIRQEDSAATPRSELDILNPNLRCLPLLGREAELMLLKAWLEDEAAVSVHALIGRAGTGKTRLAIELCQEVDGGAT